MPKAPQKLKELLRRLAKYGVIVMSKRGKGSEIVLLLPDAKNSTKGPQYPIKNHGTGTEIPIPVINAILRRFNINDFWD
jgi:hypothetical protein